MKRIIAFLVAAVATATMTHAQFHFGVEAGASINKMSFSKDVYKSENCSGFFAGPKLKGTLPLIGLGVDAALLYVHNKATIDDIDKKHMSYIRVPVNIRWEIGPDVLGIYAATGPQWDWFIGNSKLYTSDGLRTTFEHNIISWNIGAGLRLFKHLELGASYSIPLSKAGKISDYYDQVSDNIEIKNKEWQIRLNYFF